ncbi:MAG TPA: Rieske 2Fe-2S domain-containing protein [Solirubrobacteraceae bacterium]|nr:Rieske 2Fe-2S domain-containing protein [Solirubrobacteraceae bacterium]
MSTPTAPSPLHALTERIEGLEALDGPGKAIGKQVRGALGPGTVKDLVAGTWLGHPVHPLLAQVTLGSLVSATVLDLIGGKDGHSGADRLVAFGLLTYPATAATGTHDYADSEPGQDAVRRTGLVHAASNGVAATCYALSLRARKRGRRGTGTVLGLVGVSALGLGGYLGSHLSYDEGVGVDQTTFDRGPSEWTPVLDASQLVEGRPQRVVAGDTPVLVVRSGGAVRAIHDRCSHRGCSLSEGSIDGDVVECGCHGSRFSLEDGSVQRGPAFASQPSFAVREVGSRVEVRLEADGNVTS